MKNLKLIAIVSGLILALVLIAGLVLQKKLEDDPTFLNDYVDENSISAFSSNSDITVKEKDVNVNNQSVFVNNPESANESITNIQMKANLTKEEWENRIENGINSEGIHNADRECKKLFYYSQLDSFNKQLYLEIYICLRDYKTGIALCSLDKNDIDYVFNVVLADHPEIFYADGYLITNYTHNDELALIEFSPAFTMTQEEITEAKKQVDIYTNDFLESVPAKASEYDKIKYTYEYIILNTDYSIESGNNQNILSVCIDGKSVCKGYAKTFQYLTSKLGIESTLVVGSVINGDGHAWNLVVCGGQYYYVDCTWGDSSYVSTYQKTQNSEDINYDYLNITTVELQKTHIIDNYTALPLCNSTANNYYVKEGMYFTSVDEKQLSVLFTMALKDDNKYATIKCSNINVYKEMGQYLFEDQNVFYYLSDKNTSLTVYKNEDLYIYSMPLE